MEFPPPATKAWRRQYRRRRTGAFFQPAPEHLEPRHMLAAITAAGSSTTHTGYETATPAWFASTKPTFGPVAMFAAQSVAIESLPSLQAALEGSQWIVRLTADATQQAGSVSEVADLLNNTQVPFKVVRGLGLPGQVLVETSATAEATRAALTINLNVATFTPNASVVAQILPNDPDFPSLTSLNSSGQFGATADADVDAPEAWDDNTGSTGVVVGVIDSGIDYTHPDLYLNVWINQGEIPAALQTQLVDTDADGRITFYDLNAAANSSRVSDLNANTYIDAGDLFADPRWADGVDTDRNSFVDDFVGWNFRSAPDEPFEPNDPRDLLGHGTHVAGTIGAIGNNSRGVSGINWRTSLLGLKFLDTSNSGQTADAIAAINYATMMRTQFGEPVRVLNASWGQSGSENPALREALEAAEQADMLFVAAAGNGNILGQGINLDRDPFYPASSDLANVISVAASGVNDELARFSNFGSTSVDLAAPGIGVLSTLPDGRYGTANGTSMATPHVAGAAALLWSELPFATSAEVRQALLSTAEQEPAFNLVTATGGRLNVNLAMDSNVFAPRAALASAASPIVTVAGGADNLITVRYHDRLGINASTIGGGDIVATRQWGPSDTIVATYVANSLVVSNGGTDVTAQYRLAAPGGAWDPLDYGAYALSVASGEVKNSTGLAVPADPFGEFLVRIADPAVIYVNSFADAVDASAGNGQCATASGECTVRAAIQEANAAAPALRTIILDAGVYSLSIPPVPESSLSFSLPAQSSGCFLDTEAFVSSDVRSGDLDVRGNVAIYGNQSKLTTINAAGLDRALKVYPGSQLALHRLEVSGGSAPEGGGILSSGALQLTLTTLRANSASRSGGGLALFGGTTTITASTIDDNDAQRGGGAFLCNAAPADIVASTVMNNDAVDGGGIRSRFGGPMNITNTTISQNTGGAIVSEAVANNQSSNPVASGDGRYIAFDSFASTLVPGDTNNATDVFVFDRQLGALERVSVSPTGIEGTFDSRSPSISADGRFVAFVSRASNLVPGDTNNIDDIFVVDRLTKAVERVSDSPTGEEGNSSSSSPSISPDGQFVSFVSRASNLVPGDTPGGVNDIFVFDRQTRAMDRVSLAPSGAEPNASSDSPSISSGGRFVAFASNASNLVPGDTPGGVDDIFVFDRQTRAFDRVSLTASGAEPNSYSRSPSITSDGRFVAFVSSASNLVPGDTNGMDDVFVVDRQTRAIDRLDVGPIYQDFFSFNEGNPPSISADGRFVTFASQRPNLVPGDGNNRADAFVFDRQNRTVERVSVSTAGLEGNEPSTFPAISANGQVVAFVSQATNLVPGNNDFNTDIFVFDRQQRSLVSPTIADIRPITLESTTVADNESAPVVWGNITAHNSLFFRNTPRSIYLTSAGFNFFSSVDRGVVLQATDQSNSFAGSSFGPLQDNGGPTWTHALLPGSPALDAADPGYSPAVDQRGITRPQDGDGLLGPRSDLGAFEAYAGTIHGSLFLDRNRNGIRDPQESGIADGTIYVDTNKNGVYDEREPISTSLSPAGSFSFEVAPSSHWIALEDLPGWSRTTQQSEVDVVSRNPSGVLGNGHSSINGISADGRFVAIGSGASNLVPGDTNARADIFVFDRQSRSLERVSISTTGVEGNADSFAASISADGRFVAFMSDASNLVPGDNNGQRDVFVFDRQNRTLERISDAATGVNVFIVLVQTSISGDGRFVTFESNEGILVFDRQNRTTERADVSSAGAAGNGASGRPKISANGRFVTFASDATNLVPGDTNAKADVFVFDRQTRTTERVSLSSAGVQANNNNHDPTISDDGRFVGFHSSATNLAPGDTNPGADVFLYDRQTRTIEAISVAVTTAETNAFNGAVTISADGRFVGFHSNQTNLVTGDSNDAHDVFLVDRQTDSIQRITAASARETNGNTLAPFLSSDGRFMGFYSEANNLVDEDTGSIFDAFVFRNLRAPGGNSANVSLFAGQVANVDFGIVPDAGMITGRCFDDIIANGAADNGEPPRSGCSVYLDLNANGRFDITDVSTQSASDGTFSFANLDSELEYRVGLIEIPDGQTLVLPSPNDNGVYKVYLPAGGTIHERDFGLRSVSTLGQFENAVIAGRLMEAQGGGTTPGIAGVTLFVDLNDNGVRDFNEPRTISANDGSYAFAGLGNRPYTVRVLDVPQNLLQTTPIGNSLVRQAHSLAVPGRTLGAPQDVVVGDFNNDTWPDIATAIFDGNAVSILINNQQGGFLPPKDIPLAPGNRPINQPRGTGPIALVSGNFNGAGGDDLAVANSFSSNVAILLDFNGTSFASERYVEVGLIPTSLATGDLLHSTGPGTDGHLDLVVTNNLANPAGTTKNVSLLRNNGQGTFTAFTQLSGGNHPSAVATGDFNGDGIIDIAITNYGTNPSGADLGDVRVLLAQANGPYQTSVVCRPVAGTGIQPGAGPTAIVARDLNGDQQLDLAVTNFLTDNVTVCLGNGNGTFAFGALLPGGSGPTDIAAVDMDADTDLDLLITNAKTQKVGILRSRLSEGAFGFEPAESFGSATFVGQTRLALATANLDRQGGPDLVVANTLENAVSIHTNVLVGGAHRRTLTGVETLSDTNFVFARINLAPTLDPIVPPLAVDEDSGTFLVNLSGITAGQGDDQPLSILVTTDNDQLFASLSAQYQPGSSAAAVQLTLAENEWGESLVTVTVIDGGVDKNLATAADNGQFQRSFPVTVRSTNDPPTTQPDLFVFPASSASRLLNVLGNDSIAPDVNEFLTLIFVAPPPAAVGTLSVEGNQLRYTPAVGYVGTFTTQYFVSDGGIPVSASFTVEVRSFSNPWHNTLKPRDVNGDTRMTPTDALDVINFINAFGLLPVPLEAPAQAPYYDVNDDLRVSAGDVLEIINTLNAFGIEGEAEPGDDRTTADTETSDLWPQPLSSAPVLEDIFALLAADVAANRRHRSRSLAKG